MLAGRRLDRAGYYARATERGAGPGGRPYAAAMRVVSVNGAKVTFYISTRPIR
jgi:hypothetical protein